MNEVLREIRVSLRLAMNGVVSTSMREKGVTYKLNFGVSFPKIKEIAAKYDKSALLADALWKEDVREMKILATLLHPIDEYTVDKAEIWGREVNQIEIAEMLCLNLLQEVSFAQELICKWIEQEHTYLQMMGFVLFARLCSKNIVLDQNKAKAILLKAKSELDDSGFVLKNSALLALKRYGRISKENATTILALVAEYQNNDSVEKQEYFNDLKFEFEYYN